MATKRPSGLCTVLLPEIVERLDVKYATFTEVRHIQNIISWLCSHFRNLLEASTAGQHQFIDSDTVSVKRSNFRIANHFARYFSF